MNEETCLQEVGVVYFHVRKRTKLAPCDKVRSYRWEHTPTGKSGISRIVVAAFFSPGYFIKSADHAFQVLLSHWTRGDWTYTPC